MAVPWPALLVSFVVPLVWAPYMAAAMRRSSLEIDDRAMRFCADPASVDAPVAVSSAPAVRVPVFGTVVRTLFLVVVPVVVALIALGFDVRLDGG